MQKTKSPYTTYQSNLHKKSSLKVDCNPELTGHQIVSMLHQNRNSELRERTLSPANLTINLNLNR